MAEDDALKHSLVGYDRYTEREIFAAPIPPGLLDRIKTLVAMDDDDPEGIGCYELTPEEGENVARLLGDGVAPPSGLDFFLEATSAALGE